MNHPVDADAAGLPAQTARCLRKEVRDSFLPGRARLAAAKPIRHESLRKKTRDAA